MCLRAHPFDALDVFTPSMPGDSLPVRAVYPEGKVYMSTIAIASATVPGRVYNVSVGADGAKCECPGFTFRKACAHATEALRQAQAASPEPTPLATREIQQVAAIIRWLRRHPVEMKTMCWLAANDSDQPESWLEEMSVKVVKATLERFNLFYCAQCAGIVVWYSDRQVTWPSLQPHDHLEEKPEPVKVQPAPQRMTSRRPIRFTEL